MAEDGFAARLSADIQQAAAATHGISSDDVEVLTTGFAGEGCGDRLLISARPGEDYIGTADLRVTAMDDGVQCGQWRVRARLAVWLTMPVAAAPAAAGETLQLRAERVRIDRSPGTPVSTSGGPYVARTGVRAGQVVVSELTRTLPDVDAGHSVNVTVHAGSLTIRSEGFLAQPGNVGSVVRVRSAATNTILEGVLITPDNVVID
jgi:flagella basal body P-ring formation protein FlgA